MARPDWQLSGGLTYVALTAGDTRLENDGTLSADLYLQRPTAGGAWLIYIEGNSTLDEQGVSTRIIESNADAGTALDPDRDGRIQISEVNYEWRLRSGSRIATGLLDPSGYLDRSRITNDENVQFLGAPFVNNPTIEFPDYTLGMVLQRPAVGSVPQLNFVLSSSKGLADNPNLSYSQLIQFSDEDRGAFMGLGLGWVNEDRLIRLGGWINTRPHVTFDATDTDAGNHGVYAVFGRTWRVHSMNLRLGAADDRVSEGSRFVSLAYRFLWRGHAIGAGLAHTRLSSEIDDSNLDDSTQAEIFGRFTLNGRIHVTASVQKLVHSGFHIREADPRSSARLLGVRLHYSLP